MENNQVSSGVSTMPMKKKKGKSRAGIYVALVIAFLGLFGIAAAAGVMFFAFNASLSSIESSVDSQNSKIDQLSDDLMDAKNDVDMLETNMKDDSHMIPGESTSSSSSATSSQKTFSDSTYGFSFMYPSDYRLFSSGEFFVTPSGEKTYLGSSGAGHYVFADQDTLGVIQNLYDTDAQTEGPSAVDVYVSTGDDLERLHSANADKVGAQADKPTYKTIGTRNVLVGDVDSLGSLKVYSVVISDDKKGNVVVLSIAEPVGQNFAEDVIKSLKIK